MSTIRCKHCDAEVYWDVQAGALKCEYCGKITNPEDYNFNTMSEEEGIDYSHTTYKCNHCGALLVVGDKKMTSQCAYCGSALVLHDKNDKHFNPKFVIPFKISKEQAQAKILAYFKKFTWIPNVFKDIECTKNIRGVYLPYWLHSSTYEADTPTNEFVGFLAST